jgi:hypothetical protein
VATTGFPARATRTDPIRAVASTFRKGFIAASRSTSKMTEKDADVVKVRSTVVRS